MLVIKQKLNKLIKYKTLNIYFTKSNFKIILNPHSNSNGNSNAKYLKKNTSGFLNNLQKMMIDYFKLLKIVNLYFALPSVQFVNLFLAVILIKEIH